MFLFYGQKINKDNKKPVLIGFRNRTIRNSSSHCKKPLETRKRKYLVSSGSKFCVGILCSKACLKMVMEN